MLKLIFFVIYGVAFELKKNLFSISRISQSDFHLHFQSSQAGCKHVQLTPGNERVMAPCIVLQVSLVTILEMAHNKGTVTCSEN